MTKKKKVRKPRDLKDRNKNFISGIEYSGGLKHIALIHYDLKFLKKFHKWLGRAIEYLEAR